MNLVEMITVLCLVALLVAGVSKYTRWREQAELARDLRVVSDVALQYASHRCSDPPGTAVSLEQALSELGLGAKVENAERWRIVLTARPGRSGSSTSIYYVIGAGQWQRNWLLDTYASVSEAAHVVLPVYRRPGSPNQRSFQMLLENNLC